MPKVSIIMPSLNVEKYIRECIESVINQTLEDIEIIVIDAGSTDGTLEVLNKYAIEDERIKIINSKKKSYGYQLNLGIGLAQGEYVGIVETDDFIVPDMYETLYNIALENDVDFIKGYASQFYTIEKKEKYTVNCNNFFIEENIGNIVINPSIMPSLFLKDRFLWLGLYKKEFIKNIKLNETSGAAFQDVGFQLQILSKATKAMYIDKLVYFYRQDNENSSIYNKKSFSYIINEYKANITYLLSMNREWYTCFFNRMFDQINSRFSVMARSGYFWDDAIMDIQELQEWLMESVENDYLSERLMGIERWRKLQLFSKDIRGLYNEYIQIYNSMKAEYAKILEVIGDRSVVIFGAAKNGRFLYRLLKKKHKNVVAFCDNSIEEFNTQIDGVQILTPDMATKKYGDSVFVITSSKYLNEMKQQLIQNNISDKQIIEYGLGTTALLLSL